jgi:Na+-translocating ferredoxin:NAD+ oxidoreductase RnfG subunit
MSAFEKGIAVWFVVLAAGGVWLYASSNRQAKADITEQSQPEPKPPAVEQPRPDYFDKAKQAVIRTLRDPESAKFGELFNSKNNSNVVCGYVNARNGYGGYTGMERFIYFIDKDKLFSQMPYPDTRTVIDVVEGCSRRSS